jgi:hypothetical protein
MMRAILADLTHSLIDQPIVSDHSRPICACLAAVSSIRLAARNRRSA